MIASLSPSTSSEAAATSLGDGITLLGKIWNAEASWPLVLDDPSNPSELVELIGDLTPNYPNARVISCPGSIRPDPRKVTHFEQRSCNSCTPDALRSVVFATLESQVDDEVLRPKIMALLRATIH